MTATPLAEIPIEEYPSPLLAEVVAWVCSTTMTSAEIATATGVNAWWVMRIRKGGIVDPGIRRLQRIHDYINAVEPSTCPSDMRKLALLHTRQRVRQRKRATVQRRTKTTKG